ncbi:hypothetical protein SS50377_22602 [Spironucleus salmonicida]|uniref:Uncharacterized protein n=1 Tax=Spironucleus salmonicida TaxID=348837 RepID=A0A9P8RZM1_9EUKA|nr:hypothetical protein SS50377_22602 [Spironucleus salmonicida]
MKRTDYSEQFSVFTNAQSKSITAFRKLNNIFQQHSILAQKTQDRSVWQLAVSKQKNIHIPRRLLDNNGEIKNVLDTFEYLFPEVEKYTELEKASNLVEQIQKKSVDPYQDIYISKRRFSQLLITQDARINENQE